MAEQTTTRGFIDIHTHLREPGNNTSETIANGAWAAMQGGYVYIADMPNNPGRPTWTEARIDEKIEIRDRGNGTVIPVEFIAGAQPESDNVHELRGLLWKAAFIKLYGAPTTGNARDYEAHEFEPIIKEAARLNFDKLIGLHAGKDNLAEMIDLVAGKYKQRLHIHHVNDPEDVEMVIRAREKGLVVTTGLTPHHIFMTTHDEKSKGWRARMMPRLARQPESEELWRMAVDGEIDLIETDYAPHSEDAKMQAELENPHGIHDHAHATCFGVPGIEHVGAMMLRQAKLGEISMERLTELMHTKPLEVLRKKADPRTSVTWDMETYVIEKEDVVSGAGWTPYIGSIGIGRVSRTVIGGKTVYERPK